MEFFNGIKPFENNSELAGNLEILKTYKQDESNMFCKYFIKKSINREVFKMFLDINYFEYLKLQWQLKYFLIQSKDIKIEVLKYIIISILAFIGGLFYFKNDVSKNINNDSVEKIKSDDLNKVDGKIDSLHLSK